MKKSYLLLAVFFAMQSIAVPQSYLERYKQLKTTLAGYKQCILQKRACTSQEKKALGTVVATLVTFAVALGAAFGYQWYQEQMATSWAGLKRMVDQFDADVRGELPLGQIVPFNMIALQKFAQAIEKKPLSLVEHQKMVADIQALTDPSGSLQNLIQFISQQGGVTKESLERIFEDTLNNTGLDPRAVYARLGLIDDGKKMSSAQIRDRIKERISGWKRIGATATDAVLQEKYSSQKMDHLQRQLMFIFSDDTQKQRYDAFLEGRAAVKALPQIEEGVQQKQVDIITSLISALDDLKRG